MCELVVAAVGRAARAMGNTRVRNAVGLCALGAVMSTAASSAAVDAVPTAWQRCAVTAGKAVLWYLQGVGMMLSVLLSCAYG